MKTQLTNKIYRLRAIARELNEAADLLEGLDTDLSPSILPKKLPSQRADTVMSTPVLIHNAKVEYERRTLRQSFFPSTYFGEPAWNLLVDLYVHHLSGIRVSITSACIASKSPTTTALRWIDILVHDEILKRRNSKNDKRVSWLELTEMAIEKIELYLMNQNVSSSSLKM